MAFVYLLLICITCAYSKLHILNKDNFQHYINEFNANDVRRNFKKILLASLTLIHFFACQDEAYINFVPNSQAWNFLSDNIPFLDTPDLTINRAYYFRWWTYRKHIKSLDSGKFVITEFLPTGQIILTSFTNVVK